MASETTDMTLFVRSSAEEEARWDRQRIVDALIRETHIDVTEAEEISRDVEKQIFASGISLLTAPLIRELVDAKLIERGLEQARKLHARIGFPYYDVGQLILLENKENANLPHSPEGTNLVLAEGIKREYALLDVFSPDVAEAHVKGDIHIHGLGYIDRPYSCCQSLEYLKKFGLNLPHALTVSKPARHAEVLLAHMVRFSTTLQGNFAGVIAWDGINFSFAPFLKDMSDREIKQIAQMLIYEFSQLTSARGGQSMFTDIHLYWDVPGHLAGREMIGPGGEFTGKNYHDYISDARRFAKAILEVFLEGDARGLPFIFPRPMIHVGESLVGKTGQVDFFKLLCKVASVKGNPGFVFDRSDGRRFPFGSIGFGDGVSPLVRGEPPWDVRSVIIQNVTVNLPRLGYLSGGDDKLLFSLIRSRLETVVKAHLQKRSFLQKLLSYGDHGPLAVLAMKKEGAPYLNMDKAFFLAGMTGLNELVHIQRNRELHHPKALDFGLKVVGFMREEAERLGNSSELHLFLEQSPAETTAYRFARLDLKYFSPRAGHFVKGDLVSGEIYYTNSTHVSVSASLSPLERAAKEGRFHPLLRGGVMTNLWVGSHLPDPVKMADLVSRVFFETSNDHLFFSPVFTTCSSCGTTSRGLRDTCLDCGSSEREGIARITHYFSRTSGWNKGKLAELRDRERSINVKDL